MKKFEPKRLIIPFVLVVVCCIWTFYFKEVFLGQLWLMVAIITALL